MKKIILVTFVFVFFGCDKKNNLSDLKNEVEDWKIELQLNGDFGPPCSDKNGDITNETSIKWLEKNPQYGFGLGKIISLEYDFNSDKVIDCFYYFSPANCAGGIGSSSHISDCGMLVYSYKGKFLTNKNITNTIENNIESKLSIKENIEYNKISRVLIYYKEFNKNIVGSFQAYLDSDAGCCPTFNGEFRYNPIDFSIELLNE